MMARNATTHLKEPYGATAPAEPLYHVLCKRFFDEIACRSLEWNPEIVLHALLLNAQMISVSEAKIVAKKSIYTIGITLEGNIESIDFQRKHPGSNQLWLITSNVLKSWIMRDALLQI